MVIVEFSLDIELPIPSKEKRNQGKEEGGREGRRERKKAATGSQKNSRVRKKAVLHSHCPRERCIQVLLKSQQKRNLKNDTHRARAV